MILCVFLTFSTVNAADLNDSILNSAAIDSQSESSFANLNEDMSNYIVKNNEDEDCVDSMNGLSNLNDDLNYKASDLMKSNGLKSSLSSINPDENSLKSTLSPSGNTFSSIQDSIYDAKSGDTIDLNGKTFTGNGTTIIINKPITIVGGQGSLKATLDAKKLSGIFRVTAENVKIINCNLINANNKSVVFLNDNGAIKNCDFINNSASAHSAHLQVESSCNNFLLENSNFIDGYSYTYTNVAINANNSTVRNCTFINNTVRNDEGIQVTGAGLQIGQSVTSINTGSVIDCLFINNTAISDSTGTHAGALCFRPGIKVFNSTFIDNYCNRVGGATTLHSDGELYNCIFINNRAGIYGGAISTGFDVNNISVNISSCIFENNTAPMGGAIQVKGNNVKVLNSTFKGNNASDSDGGALFIMGNEALVVNSTFEKNFAKNVGAGALINGTNVTVMNSSFNMNIAGFGAAIYVVGSNANLFSSNVTNHSVISGAVFIKGNNTYVYDSNFMSNKAENGAAIYINGSNSNLFLNNFTFNDVSKKGGAVFIEGSNANLISLNFLNNSAIPNKSDIGSGLGGALYIKGDNNTIDSSNFRFNTARNGSAIYTDGFKMTLSSTDFDKNQAWSYILDSLVNPSSSYFNESDVLINFTLIGGNNIANAIYNTASTQDIYFYNVSYVSSKGYKVTGENEIHPVNGAQKSKNGSLLYQDDREDNQLVNVVVFKDSEIMNNKLALSSGSRNLGKSQDIILNKTFTTGILGDIRFNLTDFIEEPLETGEYIVSARHYEDDYYKEIDENNEFRIIPIVDLSINISSSRVNIDFNKTVKYTIKVDNYGPNNATGTKANAVVPEGLVYLSSSPSVGNYDEKTGIWTIGDLNVGDNQTLIINALTNKTGTIDFPVDISSNENDSNEKNNFNNKSIKVLMADLAIDVQASGDEFNFGDFVDWKITVKNNGPNNANKLVVSISPFEDDLIYLNASNSTFNGTGLFWEIPNLSMNDEISLVISTKANSSNKTIDLLANVSSDTFDPILSNNADDDSVHVLPLCDLIIKVDMSEDVVDFGDAVDLLVVVLNDGPDGAGDVVVSLSDLESLGLIISNASDDSYNKGSNEWFIGNLGPGQDVSLIISTKVNCSNSTVTVNGSVDTSTFEVNKLNNHDSDDLTVNPLCDLIIKVDMSEDVVDFGDAVDLLVVVLNDGPDGAGDVVVSLSDLESLGLVVSSASDDSFDKGSNEWFIGNLGSGDSVNLTVSTKVNCSNSTVIVNGSVNTITFEVNKLNNHDSDDLTVNPLCDLLIDISLSNSTVDFCDVVDLLVVVLNDGPDGAGDVIVSLSDLESLGLPIIEASNDSFDKGSYEWLIGDLGNGESASLNIKIKANRSNEDIPIVSEVDTSTFELNKENNLDNDSLKILPVCDLEITIYPDSSVVYVGENVNWIINVTNRGPDNASDVNVYNSLPEGLELIFLESDRGDLENLTDEDGTITDFIWNVGELANNESALLVISTDALNEGLILNNASVNSSTADLNESNNFDSSNITVILDNSEEDGNNSNEVPDSDFPIFDYDSDENDDSKKDDSGFNESKKHIGQKSNKAIGFSSKKTGNPLALAVLSIFALFSFPFMKN